MRNSLNYVVLKNPGESHYVFIFRIIHPIVDHNISFIADICIKPIVFEHCSTFGPAFTFVHESIKQIVHKRWKIICLVINPSSFLSCPHHLIYGVVKVIGEFIHWINNHIIFFIPMLSIFGHTWMRLLFLFADFLTIFPLYSRVVGQALQV